ncbi:MAG TPA: ribonuclease H-like domain-containing protein [Planctomycetota bacterium]|nr:ribonuclease H-like domain-containing protein [Planctomycetota bacterium]
MLTRSFIHLSGVTHARERHLWHDGLVSWDDMLSQRDLFDDGPAPALEQELSLSRLKLAESDSRWFEERLGPSHAWRMAADFDDGRIAYLDIETDGQRPDEPLNDGGGPDRTTVVAIWDGAAARIFLRSHDLDEIPEYLSKYSVLCTFNGKSFDIPYLEKRFGKRFFEGAHLDLRPITRAVGLTGGLKKIEAQIGIERPADIRRYSGYDAVKLWAAYRRGRRDALVPLLRYNLYDAVNLQTVMRVSYNWAAVYDELPFRRFDELQTDCVHDAVEEAVNNLMTSAQMARR